MKASFESLVENIFSISDLPRTRSGLPIRHGPFQYACTFLVGVGFLAYSTRPPSAAAIFSVRGQLVGRHAYYVVAPSVERHDSAARE